MAPIDLWLPPKPAIVRPATPELLLPRLPRGRTKEASFLPGMFPAGVIASTAVATPQMRRVGRYTISYSGGTTATATVQAADIQLTGANRQILVFWPTEAPIPSQVTIDAVRAAYLIGDTGPFLVAFSQSYGGAGPFNIVVTVNANSSENNSIEVYEVVDAAPLYESFRNSGSSALAVTSRLTVPDKGLIAAAAYQGTDSATFTWTGATEDSDADAGDSRLSTASNLTNASGDTRTDVTATASTGTCRSLTLSVNPTTLSGKVRGGRKWRSGTTASGATVTPSSFMSDFTGMGSFKLVVLVASETDPAISGITFNGNAMTGIGSVANTGASPDLRISAFAIDVTQAAPSGNIVITWGSSIAGAGVQYEIYCLYGVGSIGTAGTASGNATGAATSVDVNDGGCILALTARADDSQTTTWTGVDETEDIDAGAFAMSSGARFLCAAETARSIQAVGSASGQYATLAVPFNP